MTTLRCMVLEIWSTTEFFVILDYFLPFYLPKNPENQNFERMKKNTWRYHFTHVHVNENHMVYGS